MNYYNEHDPKTAAWLRELIDSGLIPAGIVDERSIVDVRADELHEFTQCHFFAGIGGWSLALQLAGWPADRPVWTGSCPCQPFSSAGKGLAQADERHLWPVFFDLIRQCRPELVFGEQVASAIGKGWLDGISADLESEGYACAAAVLGAHSVGAPHIRQRLYWVADARYMRGRDGAIASGKEHDAATGCSEGVDNTECTRPQRLGLARCADTSNGLGRWVGKPSAPSCQVSDGLADNECPRLERWGGTIGDCVWAGGQVESLLPSDGRVLSNGHGRQPRSAAPSPARYGSATESAGFWDDAKLVACRDGKTRRVPTEPAFFPLAHGIPARVVRLRGYGNAIVPQVAAEFIQAFEETLTVCLPGEGK
jgi:DNA (cytosine-5)-methyltransferase 1